MTTATTQVTLAIPDGLRCRNCGARRSEETPLRLVESTDGFGLPAFVVECVDPGACRTRYSEQQIRRA